MTCLTASHRRVDPRPDGSRFLFAFRAAIGVSILCMAVVSALAQSPGIGSKAPDFALSTPTGVSVRLSQDTAKGKTVLVVLRGFPGYQCPYCERQVHDFVEHASDFEARKANILLVYPGPPAELDQHAKEFLAKQAELPSNVKLVIDPRPRLQDDQPLRAAMGRATRDRISIDLHP